MSQLTLPQDKHDLARWGISASVITQIRVAIGQTAEMISGLDDEGYITSAAGEKSRPHITRALEDIKSIHKGMVPAKYRNLKPFQAWYKYLENDYRPFERHIKKITKGGTLEPKDITLADYVYYYILDDVETIGYTIMWLVDKAVKEDSFSSEDADRFVRIGKALSKIISNDDFAKVRSVKRVGLVFQQDGSKNFGWVDAFNLQNQQIQAANQSAIDHAAQQAQAAHQSAIDQANIMNNMAMDAHMQIPGVMGFRESRNLSNTDSFLLGYFGVRIALWLDEKYGDRYIHSDGSNVKRNLMFILAEMTPTPILNKIRDIRADKTHVNGPKMTKLKISEIKIRSKLKARPHDSKLTNQLKVIITKQRALVKATYK